MPVCFFPFSLFPFRNLLGVRVQPPRCPPLWQGSPSVGICMYVCIYICICIYIKVKFVDPETCMCIYTCSLLWQGSPRWAYIRMYVHIYIICVCVCVYIYIIYVYIYIKVKFVDPETCTYVYIHVLWQGSPSVGIHTHTHTHTPLRSRSWILRHLYIY